MSLTLGLTGMDPDTESALRSAFTEAAAELGGLWTLEPESDASFVVVDMDTLYGPMSWLRLHAAEKSVIGLTTATRTQADYRLERPITAQSLAAVLGEIAQSFGHTVARAPTMAAAPAATAEAPTPPPSESEPVEVASLAVFADLADALPSGHRDMAPAAPASAAAPAPGAAVALTEIAESTEASEEAGAVIIPPAASPNAVASSPSSTPAAVHAETSPATPAEATPSPPAPAAAPPAPSTPSSPTTLAGWLASGQLQGRQRLRNDEASVLIDPAAQAYFGPSALKPLAPLLGQGLHRDHFERLDDAAWQQATASLGEAQPLSRLVWFQGLLGGAGSLAAGYDPNDRFRLLKWPQTEREYPKHFRIATVMMKGPATLAEIAEASGVAREDVNDFVNASLATGFAQPYREPEPEPEPAKSGGLFGRLRGR